MYTNLGGDVCPDRHMVEDLKDLKATFVFASKMNSATAKTETRLEGESARKHTTYKFNRGQNAEARR